MLGTVARLPNGLRVVVVENKGKFLVRETRGIMRTVSLEGTPGYESETMACTCQLGDSQECVHIQAVKIYMQKSGLE